MDFLSELGSIVGVGVGSIDLQLVKRSYKPGEIVHGRAQLRLARATEAKRLVAALEATREESVLQTGADGRRQLGTRTVVVHRFEHPLDGQRNYRPGEGHDFHLRVPTEAPRDLPGGRFGDVVKLMTAVADLTRSPLTWRVHVFLDVPWKANVKAHADLTVG